MAGVLPKVFFPVLLCLSVLTQSDAYSWRQTHAVLIAHDDLESDGQIFMERTQNLIAKMGATFTNAFVSTPLCCPSRASMLTGRYLHNTKVVNNSLSGGCSSKNWQRRGERETFAKALHDVGYNTFYAGKYLNQYGKRQAGGLKHVPAGWDWWIGLKGNSRYYDYTLSINGTAKYFRDDYLTDVIANYALDFLRMQKHGSKPFLMVIAPPAPHSPFTPAERHKTFFQNASVPRTPNFNPGPQLDKHWLLRMPPSPLPDSVISLLDEYWRLRLRTLLSVDELVGKIVHTLKLQGQLNNTYFIVTSDNGYHLGHYGLPWDKRQPYDTDMRIPLLVRGPGIPKKLKVDDPVLLLDIAPTITDMAGLSYPFESDGRSFLPLLKRKRNFQRSETMSRSILMEYRGEGNEKSIDPKCSWNKDDTLSNCETQSACKCQDSRNNSYDCIRTMDFQFCVFHDEEKFIEAYDLKKDRFQLNNIAYKLDAETVRHYSTKLKKLKKCRGMTCQSQTFIPSRKSNLFVQ